MERSSGRESTSPKSQTSRFLTAFLSKGPLVPQMDPLDVGMDYLRPKYVSCRPGINSLKHVNCLFSLNVDSERLQYTYSSDQKSIPRIIAGVGKFHPFHPRRPPWLHHHMHSCIQWEDTVCDLTYHFQRNYSLQI